MQCDEPHVYALPRKLLLIEEAVLLFTISFGNFEGLHAQRAKILNSLLHGNSIKLWFRFRANAWHNC